MIWNQESGSVVASIETGLNVTFAIALILPPAGFIQAASLPA
jgi:hypothetical protein